MSIIKSKFGRHALVVLFLSLVLAADLIGFSVAQDGVDLMAHTRPDNKKEVYYATGDEFLFAGFDLLARYWNNVAVNGMSLLRGHADNFLPIQLKLIGHKPAEQMMRRFSNYFYSQRSSGAGLIPYSYNSYLPHYKIEVGGKQSLSILERSADILSWFPDDQDYRQKAVELAGNTMKYFDYTDPQGVKQGLVNWVDVETGKPQSDLTYIYNYGEIGLTMAILKNLTGNTRLSDWADQKMDFVWLQRPNTNPILVEQFLPDHYYFQDGPGQTSDTDTLYFVRKLYQLYQVTQDPKYRDRALAVTNQWYANAWLPQYQQFSRKLTFSGQPGGETIYGDGKWNVLFVLVEAYKVTKDPIYLSRLKAAWTTYITSGGLNGLVCERITRGVCDQTSAENLFAENTFFLEALINAYEASGDKAFLSFAEEHGRRILTAGDAAIRIENGQAGTAFLRLALARKKFWRLEITSGKLPANLRIFKDAASILDIILAADVGVVYLPEGEYRAQVNDQSRQILLNSHQALQFE
jgi:hypothetical protein